MSLLRRAAGRRPPPVLATQPSLHGSLTAHASSPGARAFPEGPAHVVTSARRLKARMQGSLRRPGARIRPRGLEERTAPRRPPQPNRARSVTTRRRLRTRMCEAPCQERRIARTGCRPSARRRAPPQDTQRPPTDAEERGEEGSDGLTTRSGAQETQTGNRGQTGSTFWKSDPQGSLQSGHRPRGKAESGRSPSLHFMLPQPGGLMAP